MNYIRSEIKRGRTNLDISSKQLFCDDLYLLPVLKDDAVLFSLGDLEEESAPSPDIEENAKQQERTVSLDTFGSLQESINQQDSTASTRTIDTIEMVRIMEKLKANIERVNRKLSVYKGHVVDFKDGLRKRLTRNMDVNDIFHGRRWSGSDIPVVRAAADYGIGNYCPCTVDPAESLSNGSVSATTTTAPTTAPDDAHYYQSYAQIGMLFP